MLALCLPIEFLVSCDGNPHMRHPIAGTSGLVTDVDGHASRAQDGVHAAQTDIHTGKPNDALEPLAISDSELTQAREKLKVIKGGADAAQHQIQKLQKQIADLKDSDIRRMKLALSCISGACFLGALAFVALSIWAGMRGGVQVAIALGVAAAIAGFAAVFLKTILIVTGIVLVLAGAVYGGRVLFKHGTTPASAAA
jgi:hypothetical protein